MQNAWVWTTKKYFGVLKVLSVELNSESNWLYNNLWKHQQSRSITLGRVLYTVYSCLGLMVSLDRISNVQFYLEPTN